MMKDFKESTYGNLADLFTSKQFKLFSMMKLMDKLHGIQKDFFKWGRLSAAFKGLELTRANINLITDGLSGFDFDSFVLSDIADMTSDLSYHIQRIEQSTMCNVIVIVSSDALNKIKKNSNTISITATDLPTIERLILQFENNEYNVPEKEVLEAADTASKTVRQKYVAADEDLLKRPSVKEQDRLRAVRQSENFTKNVRLGNSKYR